MRCSEPMNNAMKDNQESPEEIQIGSTPKNDSTILTTH